MQVTQSELLNTTQELNSFFFDKNNRIILHDYTRVKEIPHSKLRMWCHSNAIYTIPNIQLIQWLKGELLNHKAIEIGSGNGDIGYHLGITQTDSYIQTEGIMKQYINLQRSIYTNPKSDVIKLDAEQAIKQFNPSLIIASFVTQLFKKGDENKINSSIYGVNEKVILSNSSEYIHIGNDNVHGDKRILKYSHEKLRPPFLITRCADQSKNCIYIWRK